MTTTRIPRKLAVRVLTRVLSDHEPLDEVLAALGGEVNPSARGWLQEVCSGTLRWKGRLDLALDSVALKKKPSGWLRKTLLIGAYQLIVQERVSPAAVVSETVDEVAAKEGQAPAKFANAVLRKIASHGHEWRTMPRDPKGTLEEGALWASLPKWLWKKVIDQHGAEWCERFALAALERPKLWVAARRAEWVPTWAKPGPIPRSWEAIEGGSVQEKTGFNEGEFIVQDISSQILVSEISEIVRNNLASDRLSVLDLCAAPGGKAVGLSWQGFVVTASDVNAKRLQLLKTTVERVARNIKVAATDDLSMLPQQDLVWVDAPCSGTGIVRRHPDVRWLRDERSLASLNQAQDAVLKQGWSMVRPGGFLAYTVCSVLKEEGTMTIERVKLQDAIVKQWCLAPHEAPFGDGFSAVLLQKK